MSASPAFPYPAPAGKPPPTVLWLLLFVYILNFLDRQIINILAEPIKRDLDLSDTQIGLMTGLAFALFYTFLGIPIARYADNPRSSRVRLISISLALWSGMTALCGVSQNYVQLLLARVGVGIGEAGCTPAAHSLICDTVAPEKRSSAIAFYGLGIPIGGLIGMVLGGLVADAYGWRTAFLLAGIPGLLFACFLPFVMREPRHSHAATEAEPVVIPAGVALVPSLKQIGRSPAMVLLVTAASIVAFLSYGKSVWTAIFFIRVHGLTPGETGLWLGISVGLAAMLGTWLGGYFADRFGAGNPRNIVTAPAIGLFVGAPLLFAGYTAMDWQTALAFIVVATVLNSLFYGPTFACVQGLVPQRTRALATALMLFAQNLVGLGLGPLFFGMLSDAVAPIAGVESVRWVLYGAAWLGLIPAIFFWCARKHLDRELDHATSS